jgi:putative membrane protein
VTTLVLCIDRANDIGRKTGLETPVAGWEAVRSLVTEVGLADPEDSNVNTLLEGLRVARTLRDEREEAVVAVVSGGGDSIVGADRSVAAQLDRLVEEYDPDSAVVVIDSAEDERLVPVVESRLPVDGVDRVVVRQARDIESTYYLLKQFLADEELRTTVLVPVGTGLLILPLLLTQFPPTLALASLASILGAVLLYKGLAIDELVATVPEQVRDALYSGQVSVVTYVAAGGLTLVGLFLGALAVTDAGDAEGVLVPAMQLTYYSVPWLTVAALTASAGRLLDELISADGVRSPYLNLPFGVVAVGLVIRGVAGYFLEREGLLAHVSTGQLAVGGVALGTIELSATQRLAALIVAGVVISMAGVRAGAAVSRETDDVPDEAVEN